MLVRKVVNSGMPHLAKMNKCMPHFELLGLGMPLLHDFEIRLPHLASLS